MRTVLIFVIMFLALLGHGVAAASEMIVTSCTRSDVSINEVDYDQPGTDNLEFVELEGIPSASLNGYQLRLVNSSGTIYRTISLTGHSITSSGFFVIGNDDLFNAPQITLTDESLSNDKAVVALYDVTNSAYCNAVNYEGTVSGFGDWFNIGFDADVHGEGRGCARANAGWWSCNRPTTPGGSNGVVAVQLEASDAATPSTTLLQGLLLICSVATLFAAWNFRKHGQV